MLNFDSKISFCETLIVIFVFMLLGLCAGYMVPVKFKISMRVFWQKAYIKFHPDSQKDIKTIIMEKTGKNLVKYQNRKVFNNEKYSIDYH